MSSLKIFTQENTFYEATKFQCEISQAGDTSLRKTKHKYTWYNTLVTHDMAYKIWGEWRFPRFIHSIIAVDLGQQKQISNNTKTKVDKHKSWFPSHEAPP